MKKKIVIISTALIILGALTLIAILCFKLVDYIKYSDFYDSATKEFYIPDLMDGFVPQGLDYIEDRRVFLACGHMNDEDEASRIYVIDDDGEEYYYTELRNTDMGTVYNDHSGGIAHYRDYVYIAGTDGIDVFSLNDVLDKNISYAPKLDTIKTSQYGIDPAYCFVYGDELFVGNFRKDDNDAPANHYHQESGNKAVMIAFTLGEIYRESNYCVASDPCAVYSMPSYVQGVCLAAYDAIENGKSVEKTSFVLSTSWGLNTSKLYVHDLEKVVENTSKNSMSQSMIGVEDLPVYVLTAGTLVDTVEAPPMSEEIIYLDGKLWIMNESASNKYIFGKFTSGNYLFSIQYPLPIED